MPPVNNDDHAEILASDSEREDDNLEDFDHDVEDSWKSFVVKGVERMEDPLYQGAYFYDENNHFQLGRGGGGTWTLTLIRHPVIDADGVRPQLIDAWLPHAMHFGIVQHIISYYHLYHFNQGDRIDGADDPDPFFDFEHEYPPRFDRRMSGIFYMDEMHILQRE